MYTPKLSRFPPLTHFLGPDEQESTLTPAGYWAQCYWALNPHHSRTIVINEDAIYDKTTPINTRPRRN